MRAPLSVIIPTLNAATELPACLAALMEGLEAGVIRELIVVDGGSTDGTIKLAEASGAELIKAPPGRGGQLRAGALAARGQWLLFLHADTVLSHGWAEAVIDAMTTPAVARYFRLEFRHGGVPGRMVAGWANSRARWFGFPFGDQGLLVARTTYDAVGGFADMPLMEDVDIARRLGKLTSLHSVATTSAARYERRGWIVQGGRNWLLLMRYLLGADPEKLAQIYRKK